MIFISLYIGASFRFITGQSLAFKRFFIQFSFDFIKYRRGERMYYIDFQTCIKCNLKSVIVIIVTIYYITGYNLASFSFDI